MALKEKKVPAYFTAAFDLDGALKIQQIQYRSVLTETGKAPRELEMLPIDLLHVADPTPQDQIAATLDAALGDVAAGMAMRITALEAEVEAAKLAAREAADKAAEELARLRIVVDAFPVEEAPAIEAGPAAEAG